MASLHLFMFVEQPQEAGFPKVDGAPQDWNSDTTSITQVVSTQA